MDFVQIQKNSRLDFVEIRKNNCNSWTRGFKIKSMPWWKKATTTIIVLRYHTKIEKHGYGYNLATN
jgi:hypothetical protein